MSRRQLIQHYVVGDVEYGRVVKPFEMMNMQGFAHEHVEGAVKDFLMQGSATAQVGGFGYTLPGGLNISVASGRAVNTSGLTFDTMPLGDATVVPLAAAHVSLPRIDLIYAVMEAGVNTENGPLTHRQLRTQLELEQGVDPYLPENFNVSTQVQNRATVTVRQGTAAGSPVAPAAGANEAPLYHVRVEAGAVALAADKVTDVRIRIRSLRDAWIGIDTLNAAPAIANLSEAIDDRIDALLVDSVYLTKGYNDPGNLLTLDVDLVPLDARYVNVTGDNMSGRLAVHDGSAFTPTETIGLESQVDKAGVDVSSIYAYAHVQTDAKVARAVQGRARVGLGNSSSAYGGHFEAEANPGGNTLAGQFIGVYGRGVADSQTSGSQAFACGVYGTAVKNQPASTAWAGYFLGNINVTGSINKGGGGFLVDHPLDPNNKDLVFGFTEAPEHLIVLRVQKVMGPSTDATVNLDVKFGLTAGTIAALCQDLRIESVFVEGPAQDVFVELTGVTVNFEKPDSSPRTVNVVLMAARKDAFIMATQYVDEDGKLVPEQTKPVPTEEQLALLDDADVALAEGDPRIGQTVMEVVPVLIGKQGFPRHAELHSASLPERQITYVEDE